jgi:two-component system, LytTR family, sensor kinase
MRYIIALLLFLLPQAASSQDVKRPVSLPDSVVLFSLSGIDARNHLHENFLYSTGLPQLDFVFDMLDSSVQLPGKRENIMPQSPAVLGVLLPTLNQNNFFGGTVKVYTKTFNAYVLPDSVQATFFAMGIDNSNYQNYRYRVLLDDSTELLPWTRIARLEQQHGTRKAYANLGTYHYPRHQVLLEVINDRNYFLREGIIIDWRQSYTPHVAQVSLSKQTERFNIRYTPKSAPYMSRFDENTGLPLDMRIPTDSIRSIVVSFENHEAHPFRIALIRKGGNKNDTSLIDRSFAKDQFELNAYRFAKPGRYEMLITCQLHKNNAVALPFEVYDPAIASKAVTFREALPYLSGILITAAIWFAWYYRRNRRKVKELQHRQQLKQMQLQSVRSQLNPHFVFNALSSIKYLVHKNAIQPAENYLDRFADLTRTILDTSEDELISLEDELRMLDNYLQMEQLRHAFTYHISVDKSIDTVNTEIPAMLLQPFVENAVKHGVASLQGNGKLSITVKRTVKTLELCVSDNGKGFHEGINYDERKHKGIHLSRERIQLLNETYGESLVSLEIASPAAGGATIIIILKDWLA